MYGYGRGSETDAWPEAPKEPLSTMGAAEAHTAIPGGYGTPSPAMQHIADQTNVVRQRWDWINEQAQRAAMQPWEVY